ncbi:phospholipase A1 [Dysgonomonas macrotermitis]|uniref:Phosphatidylcholine 1-acylhydrolase n=2 Tax=Dysgonomonas macrotermitis TaxID=1346286 RepID=A0A1M4WTA6_9BACT|nr:phospholipase A1 [Dysgonomonas macrotermitis]
MRRSIKTGLLFLVLSSIFLQKTNSQEMAFKDSIEHIIEERLRTTVFYKHDQIEVDEESVLKLADALPAFGVFKDTYFSTGIPLNESVNKNTADVLFQISIRQRLTKSRLPFNSFLYLTYTQKSFWNLYAESAPFRDNNYNPSLGIGKYIIRNNILKGAVFLQAEHESNGKSDTESRSWNMISFSAKYYYNLQLSLGYKVWIPFVDGEGNGDLIDYRGIATFTANYITKNRKWWFEGELNPRKGIGNINTTVTASFKVSDSANQYLYARFYNGTGESLIDYNKYSINLRIGFCIKPDFGSIF